MMRAAVGIALLICGSLTLAAQSSSGAGTFRIVKPGETPIPAQNSSVRGCPIDMQASQDIWNHTIAVQKGLGDEKFGQRILLTLKDSHSTRIVSASVRVQGLNGKSRMLQTQTGTPQSWDSVMTLKVTFAEQPNGSVSGDLWIGGFTSVTSVQLLEATYADGSTWKISGSNVCSVNPDPMMLITNR